jgi:hypothetical protein
MLFILMGGRVSTASEDLQRRESLSHQELFDAYYSHTGLDRQLVEELLDHVAAELRVPVEKLRPADRFAVELAPTKRNEWDSGYGILLFELQRLAKSKGKVFDKPIATVDDYVRAMAEVY